MPFGGPAVGLKEWILRRDTERSSQEEPGELADATVTLNEAVEEMKEVTKRFSLAKAIRDEHDREMAEWKRAAGE